jgi:hypothetical protein
VIFVVAQCWLWAMFWLSDGRFGTVVAVEHVVAQ